MKKIAQINVRMLLKSIQDFFISSKNAFYVIMLSLISAFLSIAHAPECFGGAHSVSKRFSMNWVSCLDRNVKCVVSFFKSLFKLWEAGVWQQSECSRGTRLPKPSSQPLVLLFRWEIVMYTMNHKPFARRDFLAFEAKRIVYIFCTASVLKRIQICECLHSKLSRNFWILWIESVWVSRPTRLRSMRSWG